MPAGHMGAGAGASADAGGDDAAGSFAAAGEDADAGAGAPAAAGARAGGITSARCWLGAEQATTSTQPTSPLRRRIQNKMRQHTLQPARANALDAQKIGDLSE